MPFEVPEGWAWTTVSEISNSILYGVSESAKVKGEYKLLRITDIQDNKVDWESVPFTDFDSSKVSSYLLQNNDILFARTGATVGKSYLVQNLTDKAIYASYLIRVQMPKMVLPNYVKYFFESGYYWGQINLKSVGVGQPNVNGTILGNLSIPIPGYKEQHRIVVEIEKWFALIDIIESSKDDLQSTINQAKSKILDLAIHGRLVPQDPNDEPAIELLKRINPKAEITCDNAHYEQLPKGWAVCKLEDILEYEQPQAYIVSSTDYNDNNSIPVLTAGKSFVIGYTQESFGICNQLPVIIFDDFTTDSKYVDFPFKVKSSAMKILHTRSMSLNLMYISYYMNITRLTGDTHKRYWISEYSKLEIMLPPKEEQNKIVERVVNIFSVLDRIAEGL